MKMKRQEVYDHETFNIVVLEARFYGHASREDTAPISSDVGMFYKTFEPEVACFMKGNYKAGNILDVQMLDKTNRAKFGFGMC